MSHEIQCLLYLPHGERAAEIDRFGREVLIGNHLQRRANAVLLLPLPFFHGLPSQEVLQLVLPVQALVLGGLVVLSHYLVFIEMPRFLQNGRQILFGAFLWVDADRLEIGVHVFS